MAKNDDLAQIIDGCKAGQSESFSRLVDIYAGRCYGYFYRLTGNRTVSDDLLAELFIRLVEKIGTFKDGSFEGWLFRIAGNIFYDYLRKKQRESKLRESQKIRSGTEVYQRKQDSDGRGEKLQKQLGRLDEDTRELIMLRFYSELSFKEIAKMRAEPIGTILAKVHRGVKKLRELIE